MPRTMVNTLDVRSQCASLRGTSTRMRALPSAASSMRCTRPTGKPENVRSMPTTTPSESLAVSTSRCVGSNAPRAYSRYTPEPTISTKVNSSSAAALSCRCATGRSGTAAGGNVLAGGVGGGKGGFMERGSGGSMARSFQTMLQ